MKNNWSEVSKDGEKSGRRISKDGKKGGRRIDKRVVVAMLIVAALCNLGVMVTRNMAMNSEDEQVVLEDRLVLDTRASDKQDEGESLEEALADRQVYFSGIGDCEITDSTVIYLENDKENEDIFMRYQISDKETGEVLEVTDLIPAGEHIEWIPGEGLSKGEHTLIFNEAPYFSWEDSETGYVPLTQANNEVVVTMK